MESLAEPILQESLPQSAMASQPAAPHVESDDPHAASTEAMVEAACAQVPPLWPLRHFVAVNPYLGLTHRSFEDAMDHAARVFDAPGFMPQAYYSQAYAEGRFDRKDLEAVAPAAIRTSAPEAGEKVPTVVDALRAAGGPDLEAVVVDEISRWCAGRFDSGQATWKQPLREAPLFPAWRAYARIDRSPEINGIRGLRRYAETLPDTPLDAIEAVLEQLAVPVASREEFLSRLLSSILGWAGHAQYRRREASLRGGDDPDLIGLLAIRAAYDGAIARAYAGVLGPAPIAPTATESAWPAPLHPPIVLQRALEHGYQRRLLAKLGAHVPTTPALRPELQIACCIDVRSEVLRRHLEQLSDGIETIGFAGFFGVAFAYEHPQGTGSAARCPALIAPPLRAEEQLGEAHHARNIDRGARRTWFNALRKQSVGSFPFVETVGWLFGLRLVSDSAGWSLTRPDGLLLPSGVPESGELALVDPQTGQAPKAADLAESILRGMGLVDRFAPTVVLCGHGGRSPNNPFASALDCGACGGHAGDLNARVAAALLNDPDVRDELRLRGIEVPEDTVFVPAIHETTRDRIELLDDAETPADARRAQLERWLTTAAEQTRRERVAWMGVSRDPSTARAETERRGRDWSETRPEWALARNAAFIAAPRTRTRALDLDGRTFLHDYEAGKDADGNVLHSILTAPLVVASWINLQYYGSTVAPQRFGAGDKTLHNVVAHLGVLEGNGGDLRVGLPIQSVHDGQDFVHEPLRLTAVIAADPEQIEASIAEDATLRELVDHEWIHLVAWDLESGGFRRRTPGQPEWSAPEEGGA